MSPDPAASKPRNRVFLVVLVLALLGLVERGTRVVVSRTLLPTQGAAWIWAPDALERTDGLAFYAVREFELDAVPSDVRLNVLADEEYIAHLNGERFGSGAYYSGADLDSYAVNRLLRPGRNRLAVELRSDRGAGGLLLTLTDGMDGTLIVGTGADWRIFDQADGILDGSDLGPGAEAVVWQVPPTGAWGAPKIGQIRRNFASATAGREVLVASTKGRLHEGPRTAGGNERHGLIFDFGEPVTGYLHLRRLGGGPRRILMSLGNTPEEVRDGFRASRVPGQPFWTQAETRTFRYVRLWGALPDTLEATVQRVSRDVAEQDAFRYSERSKGVFGLPSLGAER